MSRIVRVFLASPGDVEKERSAVKKIVNEINVLTSVFCDSVFHVVNWENMTPDMGRPQGVVNQRANFEEIDLFLGILWSRFGSNPGENTYNAESGTQEEFFEAYSRWNEKGSPRIKIFRCRRKIGYDSDTDQLKKVQDFFNEFRAEGKHPGLVKGYSNLKEFESTIRNVLLEYALSHNAKNGNGLTTIPLSNDIPEQRWTEKVTAILKSSTPIKLMAHSGYSFLADKDSKYRPQIEEMLKQGRSIHIIISTPWTFGGFFCAIADNVDSWKELLKNVCDNNITTASIEQIQFAIEHSKWYTTKIKNTVTGYKTLREKYGELIQLRLYRHEIPASVLITEYSAFVEPYIMTNRNARSIQGLNTFEVQVSTNNGAWKNYNTYFELIWHLSVPYTDHMEELTIERLESTFKPHEKVSE